MPIWATDTSRTSTGQVLERSRSSFEPITEFVPDSALEESGFEPLVPLATEMLIETDNGCPAPVASERFQSGVGHGDHPRNWQDGLTTRMLAVGDMGQIRDCVDSQGPSSQ